MNTQALIVPLTYPAVTRAALKQIDAACADRATMEGTTKEQQANQLLAHADGATYHFARLYLTLIGGAL